MRLKEFSTSGERKGNPSDRRVCSLRLTNMSAAVLGISVHVANKYHLEYDCFKEILFQETHQPKLEHLIQNCNVIY